MQLTDTLSHNIITHKRDTDEPITQVVSKYTLCLKKNDNDVLRYNFNAHQPILIIFGRDITEWMCY